MEELKVKNIRLTSEDGNITVMWTRPIETIYISRFDVKWKVNGANTTYTSKSVGTITTTTLDIDAIPGQAYDVIVVSIDSYTQVDEQAVESNLQNIRLSTYIIIIISA